jgi:hypothetical protein
LGRSGALGAVSNGWYTEGDFSPAVRIKLILVNQLDIDREQCPVIVRRNVMPIIDFRAPNLVVVDPLLPGQTGEKKEAPPGVYVRSAPKETNGHYLPFQLDDIDQDGMWDELFFMTDIKANESKTIYLYLSYDARSSSGSFPHETHAEIGSYGRYYVPWWESKPMGWKLWFLDSVDMYGKRRAELVANHENTLNLSGHSHPRDYGNDIMWVSDTFGASAVCLLEDPGNVENVSRPRFSPTKDKGPLYDTRFAHHVIANGPLRSIIRTDLMNWRTGKGDYELRQYYTAYAGKSYSTCKVQYTKFLPEDNDIEFGVGMRKIMSEYKTYQQGGTIISNGKDMDLWDINKTLKEGEKYIVAWEAIALVVRDEYKPRYQAIEAYGGNHLLRIPVTEGLGYEFMMLSGWSEGYVNSTEQQFQNYVLKTAQEYNSPVKVTGFTVERK